MSNSTTSKAFRKLPKRNKAAKRYMKGKKAKLGKTGSLPKAHHHLYHKHGRAG